jgi:hypothetical protein
LRARASACPSVSASDPAFGAAVAVAVAVAVAGVAVVVVRVGRADDRAVFACRSVERLVVAVGDPDEPREERVESGEVGVAQHGVPDRLEPAQRR